MKNAKLNYAGRLERLLAYLVDAVAMSVPTAILMSLLHIADPAKLNMLLFFVQTCYFTWFIGSAWQASPGQRLLGMYIVRVDGRPLGLNHALERVLAFFLPQMIGTLSFIDPKFASVMSGVLLILWVGPILFREDRTGLHDQICGTRVIIGKAPQP